MTYVFDTSSFINFFRLPPRNILESMWEKFDNLVTSKKIEHEFVQKRLAFLFTAVMVVCGLCGMIRCSALFVGQIADSRPLCVVDDYIL